MIYLDNNSTMAIDPVVKQSMIELMNVPLNASSVHSYGSYAKKMLNQAKLQISEALNANSYKIIFTSSATEANNLIINNFANDDVFISSIEHSSIFEQQYHLPNVHIVKVHNNGILNLEHLDDLLLNRSKSNTRQKIVSVMLANHETGIIQPIEEVVKIAKKYNALVHVDAVQAIGKIPVDIAKLDVDFMTISSHKIAGPNGVAALIIRDNYLITPMIIGGKQEYGVRSGTENIIAIVGFGHAIKIAIDALSERVGQMQILQEYLEMNLSLVLSNTHIIGKSQRRLPNTSLIANVALSSEAQVVALDMRSILVSNGSACSSGKIETSHVLEAMQISPNIIQSAIRISLSYNNTKSDIDNFINAFYEIHNLKQIA
ncbi:MAG: cysteine desulfurase family protein [Rickettsiaceae bacterium]